MPELQTDHIGADILEFSFLADKAVFGPKVTISLCLLEVLLAHGEGTFTFSSGSDSSSQTCPGEAALLLWPSSTVASRRQKEGEKGGGGDKEK